MIGHEGLLNATIVSCDIATLDNLASHRQVKPLSLLLLFISILTTSTTPLRAQPLETSKESTPESTPASLKVDTQQSRSALITQLDSPSLDPEKRASILAALEENREALMNDYVAKYRKTIRENHKLYPENPWLAAEKIQKTLQSIAPLIEEHDNLADILDEHAPILRPNTDAQLRAHLAKLPTANREFIEATQAALFGNDPSKAFETIAAAQARLKSKLAEDMATDPVENSHQLRDSPERQAYLRRLHQHLLETNPGNTPPLAEFLNSQRLDHITNPTKSKP